jgi:Family of unknown function (DUF6502)
MLDVCIDTVCNTHMPLLLNPSILGPVLRLLVRPLARFCLAHGLKIQEVMDAFKSELLRAAKEDLTKKDLKITDSRLSVVSGLRRREVVRLAKGADDLDGSRNLIAKVIGLWRDDERFLTKKGTPRILDISPDNNEFAKLVEKVSKELAPGTVLFELERLGAVSRSAAGIKLETDTFVPRGDVLKGFEFISQHISDLLRAGAHNVVEVPSIPHHHLVTEYDRVRPEELPALMNWFLQEGHAMHLRARAEIARHDQDVRPDSKFKGKGVRVVYGSFSYVDLEEQ